MRISPGILLFASLLLLISSCQKEKPKTDDSVLDLELNNILAGVGGTAESFILPEHTSLSDIPQDPQNPLTSEKVRLGQLLFHETALAIHPEKPMGMQTYSCASCHFAGAGFQAARVQGIGEGGVGFGMHADDRGRNMLYTEEELDVQPVRTPAALNTAFQELMLWNGQFGATGDNVGTEDRWTPGTPIETNQLGYEGVETQAIGGLTAHRMDIDMDVMEQSAYKELFDAAFPDFAETDRYTKETAGLAIAAFERTIVSSKAPFQRWLKGDRNAISEQEKRGAIAFFGTAGCANCHTGPALNSMRFESYAMSDLYECGEETFKTGAASPANLGRGGFTGKTSDNFKFKVPQLYNLKDSPFYGHGSGFRSTREVVEYKNKGIPQNPNVPLEAISEHFVPLNLTEQEVEDITAFIETGLYDAELSRYEPESLLSGLCFPANDPVSRNNLDCD